MISKVMSNDQDQSTFQKGITLEQYLKRNIDHQEQKEQSSEQQDLYVNVIRQQQKNSKKLITFAIKQIDEDDEKDETEQNTSMTKTKTNQQLFDIPQRHIPIIFSESTEFNKNQKGSHNPEKNFRIKNFVSPLKISQKPSPQKKDMFRSLYGNSFIQSLRPSEPSILSSTIYRNFFNKNNKQSNSKQKQIKQKNYRQINEVLKYQQITKIKYGQKFDSLNIRIDGVKDKLHSRKHPVKS